MQTITYIICNLKYVTSINLVFTIFFRLTSFVFRWKFPNQKMLYFNYRNPVFERNERPLYG